MSRIFLKTVAGAMLAASAAAGAADLGAAPRAVVRDDFDVAANWQLATFLGRDFWPLLIWYGWVTPGREAPAGYDVYRDCAIRAAGYAGKRPEPFVGPYKLADGFAGGGYSDWFAAISESSFTNRPVLLALRGQVPVRKLAKTYPEADRASYRAWRKAHPNCPGHMALHEFDAEFHQNYAETFRRSSGEEMGRLQQAFPATYADYAKDVFFKDKWVAEAARRTTEYYFGDGDFWGYPSWYPGVGVLMLAAGSRCGGYEATGAQMCPMWTLAMAYTRGGARLYGGRPVYWYVANCYTGFRRDGTRQGGENRRVGNNKPKNEYGMKNEWWGPHNGLSPSLVARQTLYGYLTGAFFVEAENHHCYHIEEQPDGRLAPSVFAKNFNDLYRLSRRLERGVPYTPLALLFPVNERITVEGYPEMERYMGYSLSAAAYALVPAANRRREGVEGGFYNSEFADFFDVVTPDVRDRASTIRALGGYKAAVLFGNYRRATPVWALEGYVARGGTLFVACDQVRAGLVTPAMAGVKFDALKIRSAGKTLVDECGARAPLRDPYALEAGEPTTAKPFWKDENGAVLAYANRYGKGRVVTLTAAGMMPYGLELPRNLEKEGEALRQMSRLVRGELPCDLLKHVYRRVQAETLPVRVTGNIQWGLNKRRSGWLVWMFNNDGVTHYLGEEQQLDPAKTAKVKVDFARLGSVKVTDAETGRPVATGTSAEVEVAPGGWRILTVE